MAQQDENSPEGREGGREAPPVIQALYASVKQTLIDHGVEHGKAAVVQLPEGSWVIVAAPDPLPTPDDSTFIPGGGGFGGGGASGSW